MRTEPTEPQAVVEVHVPAVSLVVLARDAVRGLASGRRGADWHPDFPAEADVGLARLAVEQSAWNEPTIVVVRVDGLVVGTVALTPRGDSTRGWAVGYHVVTALRRKGIATAGLRTVGERWRPLVAETDPANTASIRVLTKVGFQLQESDDPAVLQWILPG